MWGHYRPDAVIFVSVHRETPSQCLSRSLRWKKKKLVFISQDEKLRWSRTRIIHRESESERLWSYFSAFLHECWFVLFKVIPTTLTFSRFFASLMVDGEENENLSYSAGCSTTWLWLASKSLCFRVPREGMHDSSMLRQLFPPRACM